MSLKGLAEGIILQSIEDLWSESNRAECIAFFTGREFTTCAEIAGMNLSDQLKLLNIVKTALGAAVKTKTTDKDGFREKGKRPAKIARKTCRHMHAVQ